MISTTSASSIPGDCLGGLVVVKQDNRAADVIKQRRPCQDTHEFSQAGYDACGPDIEPETTCRARAIVSVHARTGTLVSITSRAGSREIDHLPYTERIQVCGKDPDSPLLCSRDDPVTHRRTFRDNKGCYSGRDERQWACSLSPTTAMSFSVIFASVTCRASMAI